MTGPGASNTKYDHIERQFIGALFRDPSRAREIVPSLPIEAIQDPLLRSIYQAVHGAVVAGLLPDQATVGGSLIERFGLKHPAFSASIELLDAAPTAEYMGQHARLLRERLELERLGRLGARLARYASRANGNAPKALSLGKSRLRAFLEQPDPLAQEPEPLPLADLARDGIPPVQWLVPGWLAHDDIAILAGAAGVGKSTTAGALAVAIARGFSWCGCDLASLEPAPVLVIDEEQGRETAGRLYLRLGAETATRLALYAGQGHRLDTPDGPPRLESLIKRHQPRFILLDSLQQLFGAADENNATAVGLIYRILFGWRDKYGVSILLVHHKRKPAVNLRLELLELVRGSTAHGTQASTVWYATQAGETLLIHQAKRRGGAKTSLRVRYEEDGPEGPITLTGEGPVETAETQYEAATDAVRNFLADNGPAHQVDIVRALPSYPGRTIQRALAQLARLKVVAKVGHRAPYRLLEQAESEQEEAPL